jgi:hypothetical protein
MVDASTWAACLQIIHGGCELGLHGLVAIRTGNGETWVEIPHEGLSIGRGPNRAADGRPHVQIIREARLSRLHGFIDLDAGTCRLRDSGSAGGTFVNGGVRAPCFRPGLALHEGDMVHLPVPGQGARAIFHERAR